jgi:putative Mg2+ transporter-C (MgtC) family protein
MSISDGELLLRLGLAVLLCGAIGLERESRDQAAGLRTHILVGVGAALFTLVSAYGFSGSAPGARVDPTRFAAQIVNGIGFLGAGTIIRQGFTVRGLTTAAALWIVAAIGIAVGAGYYLGAAVTTGIILVALVGFRRLRPALMSRLRTDFVLLELEMREDGELGDVFTRLGKQGVHVEGMESEREQQTYSFRLELRVPATADLEPVVEEIRRLPAVTRVNTHGIGSPPRPGALDY